MQTSPSQRLFSRRTNTKIPIAKTLLQPHVCEDVQEKLIKRKVNQARYYNKGTAELETLKPGQDVRVKMDQKWVKAKVEHQVDIRSYKLRTENGQEYRRNRRHIRKTETSSNEPANVQQRSTTQNTNSFGSVLCKTKQMVAQKNGGNASSIQHEQTTIIQDRHSIHRGKQHVV